MSTLTNSYDCYMVTTNDVGPKLVITADLIRIYGEEKDSRRKAPPAIVCFIDKDRIAPEALTLVMRNLHRMVFAPGSWAWFHNEQRLRLVFGNLYYEFRLEEGTWHLSIGLSGSRVSYPYAAAAISEDGTIAKVTGVDFRLELYTTSNALSPIGRTTVAAVENVDFSLIYQEIGLDVKDVARSYLDILTRPTGEEVILVSLFTRTALYVVGTGNQSLHHSAQKIDIEQLGGGYESVLVMFDFDGNDKIIAIAQGIKNKATVTLS